MIWLALFSKEISERVNIFAVILYILLLAIVYIVFQIIVNMACLILDIYITKPHGLICEHVVEITIDGLREQTEANDTFRRWEYIDCVKANKKYIYYCVGYQCLGIPKRAFASELEAEQFFEKALLLWQESRRK